MQEVGQNVSVQRYNGVTTNNVSVQQEFFRSDATHARIFLVLEPYRTVDEIDGASIEYQWSEGQLAFVPPRRTGYVALPDKFASAVRIEIPNSLMKQTAAPHLDWRAVRGKRDNCAMKLVSALTYTSEQSDPLLVDYLTLGLTTIVNGWFEAKPPPKINNRPRLARVVEYIDDNLTEKMTIGELANVACMSPYHFARQFQQTTGRPPHGYVTWKRIERAKTLLARSCMSLAVVALSCGFASQAHFTTAFKRLSGVTPGQYVTSHDRRRDQD